ncbi:MAG: archease [Chloroflexota bacterium]
MKTVAGYQEIEHTADWALKVWAPTLPELLIQAARGMYALMGVQTAKNPRRQRTFTIPFGDEESALVHFLSEILYYIETDQVAFHHFVIQFIPDRIKVTARGRPLRSIEKLIKAVTYHQLDIQHTAEGYLAQVVFDV